jgi:hypothetical protein
MSIDNTLKEKNITIILFLVCLVFIAIGIFLRVYQLNQQILLDDEWWSIRYISKFNILWFFSHFVKGANSIPINMLQTIFVNIFGLNETLLRLANLLAGLGILFLFPWMVKKLLNINVATIALSLFSLSSFIIFYSRSARPYAILLLLSFLTIGANYLWILTRNKTWSLIIIISGTLAVYFHLYALPAVMTSIGFTLLVRVIYDLFPRSMLKINQPPSWKNILLTGLAILVLISLLYFLPIKKGMFSLLDAKSSGFNIETLRRAFELIFGTANIYWIIFLILIFLLGAINLFRSNILLFTYLISILCVSLLSVIILRPAFYRIALVFLRYSIIVVPIIYIFIGIGFVEITKIFSRGIKKNLNRYVAISVLFIFLTIIYFFSTPLPEMLEKPNNFYLHSAYQESYEFNWDKPYKSDFLKNNFKASKENIPKFYFEISNDKKINSLIEYPMTVEDHFNILYYYQHFHKKRVFIGFIPETNHDSTIIYNGHVTELLSINEILKPYVEKKRNHLSTLVDLTDSNSMENSKANLLVVHKNIMAEIQNSKKFEVTEDSNFLFHLFKQKNYPVFEEKWLWIFTLDKLHPYNNL